MIGMFNHLRNARYLGSITILRRWLDPYIGGPKKPIGSELLLLVFITNYRSKRQGRLVGENAKNAVDFQHVKTSSEVKKSTHKNPKQVS